MDFITILEKQLGITAVKEFMPMQSGDVKETFASIDALSKKVDFFPETSIETGLGEFVEWNRGYYK